MAAPSSSTTKTTTTTTTTTSSGISDLEIVSEEEMAFIEAALASTRSLLLTSSSSSLSLSSASHSRFALLSALPAALSPRRRHAGSLRSSPAPAPAPAPSSQPDIEDAAGPPAPPRSLLRQFRSRRGLAVTDVTATEWCEKQMEFVLLHGKPQQNEAMKAGSDRHSELEKEVVERIEIHTKSIEDSWTVKLMNFIVGTNQLLFQGLTRELPIIGVVEGIWMIGVIDEIRINEDSLNPFIVDTKTRYKATLPSEAQKRNSRLQMMCYKYLWDTLVADQFPTDYFFSHFELDPQHVLSEDVTRYTASLGFHAKKFEEVVTYFRNTCCLLSPSQEQLLLRYELQSDRSLLEEYQFLYDAGWFNNQIHVCLKFWSGEREASYVSKYETWKCRFCTFTELCPKMATSSQRAS